MYIYKITNKIDGRVYIGQTQVDDPYYFGGGKLIRRAVKKHGRDNFTKEILEECSSKEELDEREIYWIEYYNSRDLTVGYNLARGGDGGNRNGGKLTEESRRRISESKTGTHWGHHSEETKKRMSEVRMGIEFSEEHKKKLCEKRRQRIISDETRKKASQTSRGKINIKQYELTDPDGNTYITTEGLTKFCEDHNLSVGNLSNVISGKRSHHKGWTIKRMEST